MTSIEWLEKKLKGNEIFSLETILSKAKEMHKQEMEKVVDDALTNYEIGWADRKAQLPQQEISDEEIEDASLNIEHYNLDMIVIERIMWRKGAKWYREQLKNM